MRTTLDRLTTAAAPGRCTCSWAVIAGPRVLAGPVQPPPRLAVLLVAGDPVAPGDVPTLGVNLPVQQPRTDGLGRRLDKFPGLGYPDLDKLATHELTLPGCLLASVVLPAKMRDEMVAFNLLGCNAE